jgi:ribose-phosphate pyrophosphokinase
MNFDNVKIYCPHSDVTPALIDNCEVIDNSSFISRVLCDLGRPDEELVIISPDAGAYKLIFKLCEKLGFKGEIVTCSKSRNHITGEITTVVPQFDETKSVLIIDDIILGGRTFINIRNEIKNEKVYLAVSHGVFDSGGYGDPVPALADAFNKIYTTNSRKDEYENKAIKVIPIL